MSRGGNLGIGRYLDAKDDQKLELVYSVNESALVSLAPYKARLFGGELYEQGVSSSGGLVYSMDKRNNRINATKGFMGSLSGILTGGWRVNEEETVSLFGGDFNYYELKANLRTYYPLVKSEALIFKYNVTLGHMGSTDGNIIPEPAPPRAAPPPSADTTGLARTEHPRQRLPRREPRPGLAGLDDPTAATTSW